MGPTSSLQQIREESYQNVKERRPYLFQWRTNPYSFFKSCFYIECSSVLLFCLLRTSVDPNTITVLYALAGIVGGVLLAIPHKITIIAGAIIFFSKGILDWTDGHLARAKGKTSLLGHFLDVYGAHLNFLGFRVGFGFYVAAKAELMLFYYLIPVIPLCSAAGLTNFCQQMLFQCGKKKASHEDAGHTGPDQAYGKWSIFLSLFDDRARSVDFILLLIVIEMCVPSFFVTWIIFLFLVFKAIVICVAKFYLVVYRQWMASQIDGV